MGNPSCRLCSAFLYDPAWRRAANAAGENHWYEYVREINDQLGLKAEAITPQDLPGALGELTSLILPPRDAAELHLDGRTLEAWVEGGGVLIGWRTVGLDELFGVEATGEVEQPEDVYEPAAFVELVDSPFTEAVHTRWHPDQRLLVFGATRPVAAQGDTRTVGTLFPRGGPFAPTAAITACRRGDGWACYLAFDLAETLWLLHQGRPVWEDVDGDGIHRVSDAALTRGQQLEVLYADELLFVLRNMIARTGQPMLYQIPPREARGAEAIPDALFFWGGDDEAIPEAQLYASEFMKERGLPYHVNVMPREGEFAISKAEYDAIRANGHEVSLHYNFMDDREKPNAFTAEDIQQQMEWYVSAFGDKPICTVFHWTLWQGWADSARWMLAAGNKADNSRIHRPSPPLNPAGELGFAFGTCYPYYFWDDAEHHNARVPFLCEPITAYELGYSKEGEEHFEPLHRALEMAAHYHLVMDMFYHSCNIMSKPACRDAIDEALRYMAELGIKPVHMGNDELWRWWEARHEAELSDVNAGADRLSFQVSCTYRTGVVVMAPVVDFRPARALCGGDELPLLLRRDLGQEWAYVACPPGDHTVELLP